MIRDDLLLISGELSGGDRTHWLTAQACFREESKIQIHNTTHVTTGPWGMGDGTGEKSPEFLNTVDLFVYDTVPVDTWQHAY